MAAVVRKPEPAASRTSSARCLVAAPAAEAPRRATTSPPSPRCRSARPREGAAVTLGLDGQRVSTRLPAGVQDGQKIRVPGKGRAGANGGPPGDLLLTVRVAKHPVFSSDGLNLRVTVPVTYAEAALGATVDVPTLTGDKVSVKVPAGTASGQILRVKGRGLHARDKTGDLHVAIQVDVPRKLSREAKRTVEELASSTQGQPARVAVQGRDALMEAPDVDEPVFLISAAAELAGMHAQTLRQYDRLGLVVPRRQARRRPTLQPA